MSYYYTMLTLHSFFQDSLVKQSSQGSFVIQERQDILTTALGTEEHPGRVRTAGYGVVLDNILVLLHGLAYLTVQI